MTNETFNRCRIHGMKVMVVQLAVLFLHSAFGLLPFHLMAATNDLSPLLQQGLFEEEGNRNLAAAIADYQSLAKQFDQNRQIAATAIFRLGECYRKLGRTNEAIAQYQRVVREFTEQTNLAVLSRQNLAGLGIESIATDPNSETDGSTARAAATADDIENREIRRIQTLLQNSPDRINSTTGGNTPLRQAAGAGQFRVVTFLLDHGADIDLKSGGRTPLHEAAIAGNKVMVELLLNRGADVNATDETGGTALHIAAEAGFLGVAEALLDHHADVNAKDSPREYTPLHRAAEMGNVSLLKLLIARGAEVNAKRTTGTGWTPLRLAVKANRLDVVKVLLAANADPNLVDNLGSTPLSEAASQGNLEIVRALLDAKADPNTGLPAAIWPARSDVVRLLIQFKADPNRKDAGGDPLIFSALIDPEILKILLDAGADPNSVSGNLNGITGRGVTPLLKAAQYRLIRSPDGTSYSTVGTGNPAEVGLLLDHGANVKARRPADGATALHLAANTGNRELVELVLAHDPDVNAQNHEGQTALDYVKQATAVAGSESQRKSFEEIATLLRRHGALDQLPNWDRIAVSRPSANFVFTIFRKGTNDWNRFTLLETILNYYESSAMYPVSQGNNTWWNYQASSMMPFPDLTRVTVVRPRHDSTNETRITVNLLNNTNGIDCSKDMALEFGDVVEIPERDHSLDDRMGGFSDEQRLAISDCLKGNVQLVVHHQKAELPINPLGNGSAVSTVLNYPEAQKLLLSSSDLSRVKVTRRDPKTGKKNEWILDCRHRPSLPGPFIVPPGQAGNENSALSTELRLRDGDMIEVPEK